MSEQAQKTDTLLMGDTNIALAKKDALKIISQIKGFCATPSTNHLNTKDNHLTLDCVINAVSSKFITQKNLINYADGLY
ncbi:hypothetical protein [Legionella cincinnatiensis]|uniref:Uncharacterized protein n=1 Tax=Legionella cincinnatiensis TaxID=28085 RepID=A0A378IN53_9GAMM|nr:hypothetical protein [Legionella cincinnatiensis]KTC93392.1 hypothetical protein Lcin_0430 [Legionella cincinnatiensis]STX36606.1 Uncharacterised protein [Legionella cincinnatiensis]